MLLALGGASGEVWDGPYSHGRVRPTVWDWTLGKSVFGRGELYPYGTKE